MLTLVLLALAGDLILKLLHASLRHTRPGTSTNIQQRFAKSLHVFRKRMLNNMEAMSSFKRLNQTYLIIREKTFSELVDLFHIVFRPVSEKPLIQVQHFCQ